MSKESIRQQIEDAKKEAEKVLKSKRTSTETAALIRSLILILAIVFNVLLIKIVRKNSSNNGLPPSLIYCSNGKSAINQTIKKVKK